MRRSTLGLVLSLAVLLPAEGAAQATWYPTQYPRVTAASAPWLYSGDPIYYAGTIFYPRGATTFFDAYVMVRIGTYEGVPLFADATQTPFSVIFVPLGGQMMKPYERKRDGEVAGTVASRTPWFPVQVASEWFPIEEPPFGITTIEPPLNLYQPDFYQRDFYQSDFYRPGYYRPDLYQPEPNPCQPAVVPCQPAVIACQPANSCCQPANPSAAGPNVAPAGKAGPARPATPTVLQLWVTFDGARWYSAGPALVYSPDRFVQVGDDQGFPVFRDRFGTADEIYIPPVPGGLVAPYKKR